MFFTPHALQVQHPPRAIGSISGASFTHGLLDGTCARPQAERINLLKQAVEKYGNGKKDEDLTPCVVLGSEHCPAVAGVTGADAASGDAR